MNSAANSSRASSTCARTAPAASARLRISSSTRPCPRSSVAVTTSIPRCSRSHGIATQVSNDPVKASTTRPGFTRGPSRFGVHLEPLREGGGALAVASDDEDGVVSGNRADGFDQLRAVERLGQRLRLAAASAEHDELLDALDAPQKRRGGALERRPRHLGTRRLETWPLICTITSALDEAEIGDVARDGRLSRVESAMTEAPPELFLAVQRFLIDDFEDDGLASCFHQGTDARIHDLRRWSPEYSLISIDFTGLGLYNYSFRCISLSSPVPPAPPALLRKLFLSPWPAPPASPARSCYAFWRAIRASRSSRRHRPGRRPRGSCPRSRISSLEKSGRSIRPRSRTKPTWCFSRCPTRRRPSS